MDVEQEVEEHHTEKPKNTVVWVVWNIMFALFYPILAVFSIIVMAVMFVFSGLSTLILKIASLFSKK